MNQIFTVSALTARIRDRLDSDLRLHDLWAKGELSNVVNHRSGHRYFTLKDAESQIPCVLFRNHGRNLDFELKDGLNVLVHGNIDLYRPRGQVQLVAQGVRLESGVGLRHRELEMLKERLGAEGLFAAERKRSLPLFPDRIGVVTSPDGAALRDVLRILGTYPAQVVLSPAQVQGDEAADSVARAVRALRGKADVVVVCRGGGSAEDLWPFNSEAVARAIYECDVPVVSAVGHETDVTIADFVADLRAPTPTAAAEMLVPDLEDVRSLLRRMEKRMLGSLITAADRRRTRLDYIERGLSARRMYALTGEQRQRVDYLTERLISAEQDVIADLRRRLEMASGRISTVSPLATLARGYAIARSGDGSLLLRASDAGLGETLELTMADGKLLCKVVAREIW